METPKDTSFPNARLRCKSGKDLCWGKEGRERLVWHWLVPNALLLTTYGFWGHARKCQGLWAQQWVRKKLPKDQLTKPQRDGKPDSFLLCSVIILCSFSNGEIAWWTYLLYQNVTYHNFDATQLYMRTPTSWKHSLYNFRQFVKAESKECI